MFGMGVRKKKVHIVDAVFVDQFTETAQPSAGVEDQELRAAVNFHTGCIATINSGFRAGRGDRPADAPETDIKAAM